ncbi:DNA-methyltransferase [Streptomyces pseudovenezuelae]|uniref:DNA-methyltransferase n=1 Tax=Streptomyces pseudovenezuelae TaxID=67350 RepID=UPI002E7FF9E9|nr:site-specific DNA-methyltransferase [Streptomyces pseudovenezuelae]WUA94537.1 site-specific DNA-methyltransferase [Streptomyces pseudovenezuelae]
MIEPYYRDDTVTLYHGDAREVLPALSITAHLAVVDPPYGETSLDWDVWPDQWPALISEYTRSMWCFGSLRMFFDRHHEFAEGGWKMSHGVVWEKANGSGFTTDRFRGVHEQVVHWYQGPWGQIHADVPKVAYSGPNKSARGKLSQTTHTGAIGAHTYTDDGTRMMRSVLYAPAPRRKGGHPTEKPVEGLLDPLIRYGCPAGGLVLDPFAGSGATLDAARLSGRRAIGIEGREDYCEMAATRLSVMPLDFGGAA